MKRISIFTPLNRLGIPSGVPRHIIEIVSGLLRDPLLNVSFFCNTNEGEKWLPTQGNLWTRAPRVGFSQTTARMSRLWGILNRPSFEALGGSADWLYLPADAYVPVEKAKLAVTIHDVYKLESPVPGQNRVDHYYARLRHWIIYNRVAAFADRILTISRFSADRIMHYLHVPASQIEIIYNGVSSAFFSPKEDHWADLSTRLQIQEGQYFVYSGGLKAKKNGRGIIAAWREFEARHKHLKLVVLGYHDPTYLTRARRELRRAVFPERLNDAEMAAVLSRSLALFFPSFYEGFGIPVIEALAAGTCVIASDIPALRELAGDLAFYVDPYDPKSMASGMEQCLQNESERRDRVSAGRRRAAEFTWQACVEKVRGCLT